MCSQVKPTVSRFQRALTWLPSEIMGRTEVRPGSAASLCWLGSPIGDSKPPLIALGATVVLRKGGSHRELPLEDL